MSEEPVVVCAICDAVVAEEQAEKRTVENPKHERLEVWVCKNCLKLGSQVATRKYIFKEEKQGYGRQEPPR